MFSRIALGVFFSSALFGQTLAPPQNLSVTTATSKQVQLKWTAGDSVATGYVVERKVLGGDYSTLLTSTATSATDSKIDPYTTYVYRVRGTLAGNQSDPSNEVTVGPPPYGYNTPAPLPADVNPYFGDHLGKAVSMVLDTNGDPAVAYTATSPLDGDFSTTYLYFVRWNRAKYQWTTPVRVKRIGDVETGTLTPISLAQDASNGAFGIAFEDESSDVNYIGLALSTDGGQTWKLVNVTANDGTTSYLRPSLAMAAGSVHISFYYNSGGITYVTGKESDDPSNWTSMVAPVPGGYEAPHRYSSLALDSSGKPGIAFIVFGSNGLAEAFWRPGSPSVVIYDDGGHFTDDPDIGLAFFGLQPRVGFYGALDDNFFADTNHTVWFISSADGGVTWMNPVNLPGDLGATINGPLTIAAGPQGQTAIATENNSGDGTANCTQPKLSMSSDGLMWTTCGTETNGTLGIFAGKPQVLFSGNGKLYLGFQQTSYQADTNLPVGITVWRQPPDWAFPPPPPVQ